MNKKYKINPDLKKKGNEISRLNKKLKQITNQKAIKLQEYNLIWEKAHIKNLVSNYNERADSLGYNEHIDLIITD